MLNVAAGLSFIAALLYRYVANDELFSYLFYFTALILMLMSALARSFKKTTDKLRDDLNKLRKSVKSDGKDV